MIIGKNWEVIEQYKKFLIYRKNGILYAGNNLYTFIGLKSVQSAKNRITRHINRLPRKKRRYYEKEER